MRNRFALLPKLMDLLGVACEGSSPNCLIAPYCSWSTVDVDMLMSKKLLMSTLIVDEAMIYVDINKAIHKNHT